MLRKLFVIMLIFIDIFIIISYEKYKDDIIGIHYYVFNNSFINKKIPIEMGLMSVKTKNYIKQSVLTFRYAIKRLFLYKKNIIRNKSKCRNNQKDNINSCLEYALKKYPLLVLRFPEKYISVKSNNEVDYLSKDIHNYLMGIYKIMPFADIIYNYWIFIISTCIIILISISYKENILLFMESYNNRIIFIITALYILFILIIGYLGWKNLIGEYISIFIGFVCLVFGVFFPFVIGGYIFMHKDAGAIFSLIALFPGIVLSIPAIFIKFTKITTPIIQYFLINGTFCLIKKITEIWKKK